MDKVGRSLKTAGNAFEELEGTRRRGVERELDKIEAVRRNQAPDTPSAVTAAPPAGETGPDTGTGTANVLPLALDA